MTERIRNERQWPRELTLRLGSQVVILALALVITRPGPLPVAISGCVASVWALVNGPRGGA